MSKIIDKINARRRKFRRSYTNSISGYAPTAPSPPSSSSSPTSPTSTTSRPLPPGWYHSFEYFPPKTEPGLDNLLTRIDRMSRRLDPLFIDVTWGESGSTAARTLSVASHAQRYCGVDVLMHLTCMGLTRDDVRRYLDQARRCGIKNILALRGDPPRGKRRWEKGDVVPQDVGGGGDCARAIDLVRLIRELHGDYFGIAVAGHPEGHPASFGPEEELAHLKEKVDAGADLIITQFFYDPDVFLAYVRRCRSAGIACPILPGIMPIQSYASFVRMTDFCDVSVPPDVLRRLEPVKDDDEAVKRIGWEIATDLCRRVMSAPEEDGGVDGVHFYTLNLERSVTRILIALGAVQCADVPTTAVAATAANGTLVRAPLAEAAAANDAGASVHAVANNVGKQENDNDNNDDDIGEIIANPTSASSPSVLGTSPSAMTTLRPPPSTRPFPWRPSALEYRSKREDVRPINWANRPKSYVLRTEDWDEFPNGRWGDSSSPAFGELSDVGHFVGGIGWAGLGADVDRRDMLGGDGLSSEQDVAEVFARYVEGTVPHIPWCETPLQPESFTIQTKLASLNRAGFLTVNSQPPVNGEPSSHPVFGWGGEGGYVYQKAYCECFVSRTGANRLVQMVSDRPSMNLYAVDNFGNELRVGVEEGGVTALTWGVFPNREILQPTVFDPATFLVWAEEAFSLWTSMWMNLYEPDSRSYEVLETIRDSYYLVAIIDNDFIGSGRKGGEKKRGGGNCSLWDELLKLGCVNQ